MKQLTSTQRTEDWYRARIGIPTASDFSKVMMGTGTRTRQDYMCRLIMERIIGRGLSENIKSKWMEHGIVTEHAAASEFSATQNLALVSCGFIVGDDERYGCSPDYLIKDREALLEIKCPAPWTHARYHLFGPGDDYKAQVQGQLLVTGYETVYFYSYFPGLPPYLLETGRDEKYIKKLFEELELFCDELDVKTSWFLKRGETDLNTVLFTLSKLMPED
jgi:hypothetical protein